MTILLFIDSFCIKFTLHDSVQGDDYNGLLIGEIQLCTVAVNSGSLSQSIKAIGIGGHGVAVGSDGIRQNAGSIGGGSIAVDKRCINCIFDVLGSNTCNGGSIGTGTSVGDLDHTGGILSSQNTGCSVVSFLPVVHRDPIHRFMAGHIVIVNGESASKGNTGIALHMTAFFDEGSLLDIIRIRHLGHHVTVVGLSQSLLRRCQVIIDQVLGVVAEVGLSSSAVVQHGNQQSIQSCIAAAKQAVCIVTGAVVHQLGVIAAAVAELGIDGKPQRVAHILCRDPLGSDKVQALAITILIAGDHAFRIVDIPGSDLGTVQDQARFYHIVHVGCLKIDIQQNLILERERRIAQLDHRLVLRCHVIRIVPITNGADAIHVSMAQRSSPSVDIAIAALGTGVGGKALLGAGRSSDLSGIAVTGGCNGFRPDTATVAAGEGLDTLCLAAGFRGNNTLTVIVTQGGDEILGIAVTADQTGMGGAALLCTAGSSDTGLVSMAQGLNMLRLDVPAGVAGEALLSGSITVGFNGDHTLVIAVAQSSDPVVGILATASGTGMGGVTFTVTGRYGNLDGIPMTSGRYRFRFGVPAGEAGKQFLTFCFTARRSGNHALIIVVAQSSDTAIRVTTAAFGAGMSGEASFCASGSSNLGNVVMFCSFCSFRSAIAADFTGKGLDAFGFTAGNDGDHTLVIAMAQCGSLAVDVTVAAVCAGMGGEALLGTSGGSNLSLIIVTGGGNLLRFRTATGNAGESLDTSGLTAGGSGNHALVIAVAQGICLAVGVAVATVCTGMGGEAGLGTGGCRDLSLIAVTGGRNHCSIGMSADSTGIGSTTGFGAGRCR